MNRRGAARRLGAVVAVVAALAGSTSVNGGGVGAQPMGPDVMSEATSGASSYVPVGPIRLADTRTGVGFGRLDEHTIRVPVHGHFGVPDGAVAAVLTVTAAGTSGALVATVYPGDTDRPLASTLNATQRDQTIANGAVVALGGGAVDVYVSAPTDLVVDLSGVFVPASTATSGRFTSVAPRRLLDTRLTGDRSPVPAGRPVTVPLPDDVPLDATALAVNITVTGPTVPGYVTLHPAGQQAPWASHLNTDRPGQTRAAAAIVPVSAAGLTATVATGGHVVLDLAGWFTGPSATSTSDGLFVPSAPRRVLDTRSWSAGVPIWPDGTVEVPEVAAAVLVNTTATEAMAAGFVTLHPAGTSRPLASNLNVDPRGTGSTVANMAVVRASTRGLAAYSSGGTHLVVDLAGVFLGQPAPALLDPAPNVAPARPPTPDEISLLGDSLVAALPSAYVASLAERGVATVLDAQSSRALRWGWQCRVNGSLRIVSTPTGSGCRREGLEQLSYWRSTGQLRDEVVVALGNNDAVLYNPSRVATNFDTVRGLIGDRPVHLVSVRALGALDVSMQRFNDAARAWCAADRSCRMIEWALHPAALARSSYLNDGEHLTLTATRVRAEVIATAVAR